MTVLEERWGNGEGMGEEGGHWARGLHSPSAALKEKNKLPLALISSMQLYWCLLFIDSRNTKPVKLARCVNPK